MEEDTPFSSHLASNGRLPGTRYTQPTRVRTRVGLLPDERWKQSSTTFGIRHREQLAVAVRMLRTIMDKGTNERVLISLLPVLLRH